MQVRLRLRRKQEFLCNGSASAKLGHFSSGHHMNLRPYDVAFIIVNKGSAKSFASRCAKALAFVAPCTFRKIFNFGGKRVAS
eukprot:3942658-Pleurochrysis_carterae.AAC.1